MSPVEGELVDKYRQEGIPLVIDASILKNPLEATRRFLANYDLIIANTILSWRSVYISKEKGVPVVWFIHESEFGRKLAEGKPDIAKALDTADVVMFPSYFTANLYRQFSSGQNFEVVYQGIDSGDYKKAVHPKPHGKLHILHVGSIEARKGQDVLANCILSLPEEFSKAFEFYIVGRELEEYYYVELKKAIGGLSNVHVTGEVVREEMFKFYDMADVFVCTSRDESFPLSILEAMSRGKAIISSSVGGIPEMIEDGCTGILIPKDDPEALMNRLIDLYQDDNYRSTLGKNAREKYKNSFSVEKYGDRFLEIIKRHNLISG